MKLLLITLLLSLSPFCVAANEIDNLKKLESDASRYRMMAIECVTDVRLTKKDPRDLGSCSSFFLFVREDYPSLKSNLESAEIKAKEQGNSEGLQSETLREKLVLIMSIRSHMNIAGSVSKAIGG